MVLKQFEVGIELILISGKSYCSGPWKSFLLLQVWLTEVQLNCYLSWETFPTSLVRINISFLSWTPLTSVSFFLAAITQVCTGLSCGMTGVHWLVCLRRLWPGESGLFLLTFGPCTWRASHAVARTYGRVLGDLTSLLIQLMLPKALQFSFHVLIFQIRKNACSSQTLMGLCMWPGTESWVEPNSAQRVPLAVHAEFVSWGMVPSLGPGRREVPPGFLRWKLISFGPESRSQCSLIRAPALSVQPNPGSDTHFLDDDGQIP